MSSPRVPSLRVSDADRDAVSARLRDAFAEGRLTAEEFSERTDRALAARTAADLVPLTADLPVPPAPAVSPGARSAAALARQAMLRRVWAAWLSMAVVLTAIWVLTAVTSPTVPNFWPAWPLGLFGAGCVTRTIGSRRADAQERAGIEQQAELGLRAGTARRVPPGRRRPR